MRADVLGMFVGKQRSWGTAKLGRTKMNEHVVSGRKFSMNRACGTQQAGRSGLARLAASAVVVAWCWHVGAAAEENGSGAATPVRQQHREGDVFKGLGTFASTGDRMTFYPEQPQAGSVPLASIATSDAHNSPPAELDNGAPPATSFRMLENLALERVARVTEDASGFGRGRLWYVQGTLQEFRGTYYLLLDRAVLKGRSGTLESMPVHAQLPATAP